MKFLTLYCSLIFIVHVQAAETQLARITSDTTTDVTFFYIETNNDGLAQAMRYVTVESSGHIAEDVHGPLDEVLNEGVVVKVMEGREIIRLFLEKFNPEIGGIVRLRYLASGLLGSTENFYIKIVKADGKFVLIDKDGSVASDLYIWGNWSRILRRWIGVSSIEVIDRPAHDFI